MRRFIALVLASLLTLSMLCGCSDKVEPFNLSDFEDEIEEYAYSENLGEIPDAETAKEKAEELWISLYGEWRDIEGEKPFKVFFDEENEVWYVKGALKQPLIPIFGTVKGGTGGLIVTTDGEVLAVWHF
ncbi:MAG: hypothetical protein IJX54_04845 [Oscillospiraceae bacterium]|nr:hypothetical protein [Oscillospiraceae bacterium]